MGMSASQVRLLTITARIHDLENEAQRIQNQKLLLANESDEAYQEYLAALEQKNIQTLVFNSDTGKYNWNEVGVQGLCDNGYALKVNGYVHHNNFTTSNQMWNGITDATTLEDAYQLNPPTGFINPVTPANTSTYIHLDSSVISSLTSHHYNDPILITSAQDLIDIGSHVTGDLQGNTFVLANDIDFTGVTQTAEIFGFIENATFDGNGHCIKGLKAALFDKVENVNFKNLGITNTNSDTLSINDTKGILANKAGNNVTIGNCYFTDSTIYSSVGTGGIVGCAYGDVLIEETYANNIDMKGDTYQGGFIGTINGTAADITISNSYSTNSDMLASANGIFTGGFIGDSSNGGNIIIKNAYSDFHDHLGQYDRFAYIGKVGTQQITINDSATYNGVTSRVYPNNHTTVGDMYTLDLNLTIDGNPVQISCAMQPSDTIQDLAEAIQTELGDDYTVNIVNNSFSINSNTHTVTNISSSQSFVTNMNRRLGLGNGTSANVVGPEREWVYCHSMQDVRDALGCPSTVADSPAFLRELLSNAMAIVCTYEDVEEEGETVRHYTETSVSVDTHIKEEQNNSEMAKAEADYESALRKIDQKDKKYDKELAAIENQRTAVKEEFDTLKTCIKDNIDRTFKIFS